jgi:hypothetical protein
MSITPAISLKICFPFFSALLHDHIQRYEAISFECSSFIPFPTETQYNGMSSVFEFFLFLFLLSCTFLAGQFTRKPPIGAQVYHELSHVALLDLDAFLP